MKNRWTLSFAAIALVVSAFPALAAQGNSATPKSQEQKKLERKIDGVTTTPFVTKHQGESLKKVIAGGERMKEDEKLTLPDPMQPKMSSSDSVQAPAQPGSAAPQGAEPGAPQAQPEAPKPEEAKKEFRLMGTVCGKGPDLAIFDKGEDWPAMLKAGDALDEKTKVISVENGKVTLEKLVMPAQAASAAQMSPDGKTMMPARPAQAEKRERYDLYTW